MSRSQGKTWTDEHDNVVADSGPRSASSAHLAGNAIYVFLPPVVCFAQLCTTETTAELLDPLNHCKAAIKAAIRGPITQGSDIGEAMGAAVLEASEVVLPRHDFRSRTCGRSRRRLCRTPPTNNRATRRCSASTGQFRTTTRSCNLAVPAGVVCVALHVVDPLR